MPSYIPRSHERNQGLDALLDSAADGIIIMSADHKIEKCNQAFARILRKDVSEIEGSPHDEIFNWESLQQGTSLEEAELSGWPLTAKANLYVEGDLKRPSGEIIPVGITYAPLLSGEGKLDQYHCIHSRYHPFQRSRRNQKCFCINCQP